MKNRHCERKARHCEEAKPTKQSSPLLDCFPPRCARGCGCTLAMTRINAKIMGVLNITPDSFSDGGQFLSPQSAYERAAVMLEEGVDIIDVGGESTRPGAPPVSEQEELDRVLPVIQAIQTLGKPISIDTRKPTVMREALRLGVSMVNDINALQNPAAMDLVASHAVQVCLMHMQGEPDTMQDSPDYEDPVSEVYQFLKSRIQACEQAGIERSRILIDPGFGFGKTLNHNLALLQSLSRFHDLGCPLLVGLSRKAMFGLITGKPASQRMPSSLTAAVISLLQGVSIIRTHDIAPTRDALSVLGYLQELVYDSTC